MNTEKTPGTVGKSQGPEMTFAQADDTTLTAAREWTAAGCSVIPIRADGSKAAAVKWTSYQHERADDGQLSRWFGQGSRDGLAVVCGAVSGQLEMIELEGRALCSGVGRRWAARLDAEAPGLFARLNEGPVTQSPSGGLHFIYRIKSTPETDIGNTKLASRSNPESPDKPQVLIETRGEGGYFIVAPSGGKVHPTGNPWQFVGSGRPADIPALTVADREILFRVSREFDEMPERPVNGAKVYKYPGTVAPIFPGGIPRSPSPGNPGESPIDHFNRVTTWPEILEPLGWVKTGDQDGATLWRRPGKDDGNSAMSGGRSGDRFYVFSTNAAPFDEHVPYDRANALGIGYLGTDNMAEVARELRRAGWGGPEDFTGKGLVMPRNVEPFRPNGTAISQPSGRLRPLLLDESAQDMIPPADPMIVDILDHGSIVMVYGDRETFKTFIALDWGLSIVTGKPWQDHETDPGRVLYIAGEGGSGIRKRRKAWQSAHGISDLGGNFYILNGAVQLKKPDEVDEITGMIQALGFSLVIVDTLNKCGLGLDENSATDMGLAIDSLQKWRNATPDSRGAVVLIHHTAKDGERERGSSALMDGVDAAFLVKRKDGRDISTLFHTKNKDGEKHPPVSLGFRVVELDEVDKRGRPLTSGVLECAENEKPDIFTRGDPGENNWNDLLPWPLPDDIKRLYNEGGKGQIAVPFVAAYMRWHATRPQEPRARTDAVKDILKSRAVKSDKSVRDAWDRLKETGRLAPAPGAGPTGRHYWTPREGDPSPQQRW